MGVEENKVVGLMAIDDYPLAPEMVYGLSLHCSTVILRLDMSSVEDNTELHENCVKAVVPGTRVHTIRSRKKWNRWNWRQELIDEAAFVRPDYVLFIDSDEAYHPIEFWDDFCSFMESGHELMMFDYEMKTVDGRKVMKYPKARHCKAYKWVPGITYHPYRGYARPTWPTSVCREWPAHTPIYHYCFYTRQMESVKMKNLHK